MPSGTAPPDATGRGPPQPQAGPPQAGPAMPLPRADRVLATTALMLASGMQAADATIANVALPQLEAELGGGIVVGAWVVTSYLAATAVVAPLTGGLRRRFGPRLLFTGAVCVFAIASLLCALAPSAAAIIAFRILQGAAGGVIHPLAQAILLDLHPREQHGRMMAIWGATVMLGPIAGPAIGGLVTDLASWRLAFALNLPLAAVALWAMWRALPPLRASGQHPIDLLGVALLAIAVGGAQLLLTRGVGRSWLDSPELLIEAACALIAIGVLVARSRRAEIAGLRAAVFADVNFATAAFYNFTISALLFVTVVFVPALCQGPLDYSATSAGLALVPRGIAAMLMMLLSGQLLARVDGRILLAIGLALMAAGLAMIAAARPPGALQWIVTGSTLQAIGGGMLITSLSTVGFSTLAAELRTDAAGVYSLLRQLGCACGVALMTAVLHARLEARVEQLRDGLETPGAEIPPHFIEVAGLDAYAFSFEAMAIAALFLLPAVLLFRLRPVTRPATRPA